MSGSRHDAAERLLAEQHLGDRLSALVDGELGHDTRERVLAHVATCAKCKTEVDAQRRLKNVFAEVAPPAPSESFLARLQGLPGGGDADGGGGRPLGGSAFGDGVFPLRGTPVRGTRRDEPFEFGYVPARDHGSVLSPASDRGFRIHPVGRAGDRHDTERSRGMRFAFVAAGAVSLAAIALGGMTTVAPVDTPADGRAGSGSGSNVTPVRTPGTGSVAAENQRRRAVGPLLSQGGQLGDTPVAPTEVSAPLLPGMPAQPGGPVEQVLHRLTTPMVAGAAVMSPLIRPLGTSSPVSPGAWTGSGPKFAGPGLLAAPVPLTSSAPSPSSALPPSRHTR
ncbi:anti-sigma factor family protein [Streptomyces hilarionis]|uniref:anti-sigma factor family protein n=1 Tax=Streptomyces hilarionis TaxID=2839954 RepID=UPI002119E121|nr:zf-HC2 domain-containing protein [Streptomyces hilarionis]MCQ9130992.1 zf-HC2 domain-containing protein [Streptomyces hilarionis]